MAAAPVTPSRAPPCLWRCNGLSRGLLRPALSSRPCGGPRTVEVPLRDLAACRRCGSDAASRGRRGGSPPPLRAQDAAERSRGGPRTSLRGGSPPRPRGLSVVRRRRCVPRTARRLSPDSCATRRRRKGDPRPTRRLLLPGYGVRAVAMVVIWHFVPRRRGILRTKRRVKMGENGPLIQKHGHK